MSVIASQITGLSIVFSSVCLGADQRKLQSIALLALCEGNPPVTGGFPSQMASNGEDISFWLRHHVFCFGYSWFTKTFTHMTVAGVEYIYIYKTQYIYITIYWFPWIVIVCYGWDGSAMIVNSDFVNQTNRRDHRFQIIASWNVVNIGSGNGLSSECTKPLPEPLLTYYQYGCVVFIRGHNHRKIRRYQSVKLHS